MAASMPTTVLPKMLHLDMMNFGLVAYAYPYVGHVSKWSIYFKVFESPVTVREVLCKSSDTTCLCQGRVQYMWPTFLDCSVSCCFICYNILLSG